MITIRKYTPALAAEWDALVKRSSSGTFLHERAFMDYHSDRFDDYSLMAWDDDKVVALLPACRKDDTLYSHAGLTYGGWLVPVKHFHADVLLQVMAAAVAFLRQDGVTSLIYKPVPHIYHQCPADDDLYVLYRHNARLTACNLSQAIDLDSRVPFDRGNKASVNHAAAMGVSVRQTSDFAAFWQILEEVLLQRHNRRPVHTLDEITLLHSRFPANIELWGAYSGDTLVAGTVLFVTPRVVHSQYIAASEQGRRLKALPLLFDRVIDRAARQGARYFDFGISTEDAGRLLNVGLMQQKARMGGRGVVYNTYQVKL